MAVAAPAVTSLRERKKQATRQALHEAAFQLVEAHGLAGTTVEAISEAAGVAARTFWAYFASKEDAVLDHDPERVQEMRRTLLDRPAAEDPTTALYHVLLEQVGGRLIDHDRSLRRQQLIRREPHLMAALVAAYAEMEQVLTETVAERVGADPGCDVMPGAVVAAACGACRVAHQRWADLQGRAPFEQVLADAFARLAEGFSPFTRPRAGAEGPAVPTTRRIQ
jgi:AcrR family transcriptional regulator